MKKNLYILIFSIVLVLLNACSPTADDKLNLSEPQKNISGSWSVLKVVRNGQDITGLFDFSHFRINFNTDGTYDFENYLPFAVSEPGTWTLDDPQYAYKINFLTNSQQTTSVEFSYPITDGKRQIQFNISPGCDKNSYSYLLQRVSE